MDLLLDPDTHDLVFVNGATPVTSASNSTVSQRLKVMLLTFKGEWFLDVEVGIPYREEIFGKGRSKAAIDAIFAEKIIADPDVEEITYFESTLDNTRQYSLVFRVRTLLGTETENIEV